MVMVVCLILLLSCVCVCVCVHLMNRHFWGCGDSIFRSFVKVEGRSHDIWGGEAGLQEEHQRKSERREKKKERKYAKEIKGSGRCYGGI